MDELALTVRDELEPGHDPPIPNHPERPRGLRAAREWVARVADLVAREDSRDYASERLWKRLQARVILERTAFLEVSGAGQAILMPKAYGVDDFERDAVRSPRRCSASDVDLSRRESGVNSVGRVRASSELEPDAASACGRDRELGSIVVRLHQQIYPISVRPDDGREHIRPSKACDAPDVNGLSRDVAWPVNEQSECGDDKQPGDEGDDETRGR